jgi:hypothetical protein
VANPQVYTAPAGDADGPHSGLLQGVGLRPIFIMGFPRSGTTILYHLLCESGCFNFLTAFQVVHRNRLLDLHLHPEKEQRAKEELAGWFEHVGLNDRGYDAVPVGPDYPEEYGYALDYLGIQKRVTAGNIDGFLDLLRKTQFMGKPANPLLLKNPWDANNFLEIRRLIPHARFVFIHRGPVAVVSSQFKMFSSMIRVRSDYDMLLEEQYRALYQRPAMLAAARILYSESLPFLYWRVFRNVARTCDYMTNNSVALQGNAIHVTYPQLCAQPVETIRKIFNFLGVESEWVPKRDAIQTRNAPLHPVVERKREEIQRRTKRYCEMFGL